MVDDARAAARRHRALLVSLFEREIRNRFIGAGAGGVWVLLHPLLLLAIYTFVFRTIFRVELPDIGAYPFVVFVAVALWPWMAFQEGVQRGALCIQANAPLIKKVAFPNELLVIATVGAVFAIHLFGFVCVLFLLALFGYVVHWQGLLAAVPLFAGLFALALGLAGILGALQVVFRDVEQILAPVLMVLFYATPVLYPLAIVPEPVRSAMAWNPLALMIEPLRAAMLRGELAGGVALLLAFAAALAFLALAWWVFRRLAPHFEDFV